MESGSLLAEALQYMQKVHQHEKSLPFDVLGEQDGNEIAWQGNESNSIIFSLFCVDSQFEKFYHDHSVAARKHDGPLNLKEIQQRLAYIHTVIHDKLIPLYKKRYAHTWFSGGEGLSFGIHCCKNNGSEEINDIKLIPHLKAVVNYGPHPIDEQYALALILNISRDLHTQYNINTAVSCWDVDDGQILLIEGADSIPDWVDDVIGVEGMTNRVYVVNGEIQILDPSVKSTTPQLKNSLNDRSMYNLTLKESLVETMSRANSDDLKTPELELNGTIHKWLKPFLSVTNESFDLKTKRNLLKDHMHTAAVVLPLRIAVLIQERPDLIPCSILQFCAKAPDKLDNKRKKKSTTTESSTTLDLHNESPISIQYENLVFTTISLSKSLYAMLLTAAGQIPPPIKIPKQYKSVELNRMKRQCLLGGEGYAHFRHAIEVGLRLTMGFDWILNEKVKGTTDTKKQTDTKNESSGSIESRISHHCRIDKEAGGDGGKWIQAAWTAGPNATSDENDISSLVKCPVWYPEISKGGICPLAHSGTSVYAHIRNSLKIVDKKDLGAINTTESFPFPRMDDVDSDSWIDMNSIDELETKMSEMTATKKKSNMSTSKDRGDKNVDQINSENDFNEITNLMQGLDSFVNKESELEGVVSKNREMSGSKQPQHFDLNTISPKIFLSMMHKVLKAKTPEEIDDFSEINDNMSSNDPELLQYFSRDDLNLIGTTGEDNKYEEADPTSLNDIMNAMDEELRGEDLDRTFKVPQTSDKADQVGVDNGSELAFDDPTAIKSNVISNILESLDAQDGKSGPVSNILNEMGITPPGDK